MNYGHGHVVPRSDGLLARCGGPALCSECKQDLAFYAAGVRAAVYICAEWEAFYTGEERRKAAGQIKEGIEELLLEETEGETCNEPGGMQSTVAEQGQDELRIDPRDLDGN